LERKVVIKILSVITGSCEEVTGVADGTAPGPAEPVPAAGTELVGMIFLGDAVSTLKLVSIGLVLAGVIGLNLSGVTPP
jgi:hypothetical protein